MRFVSTPLSLSFDQLVYQIVALENAWTCDRERASLCHASADLRHHMCAALVRLDDNQFGSYETIDGEAKILAHEAFLSVLALGQLLVRAADDGLADERAIDNTRDAVDHTLDLLTPFVSRAD